MVTIKCEKCGKEFSDPRYLSKAQYRLNTHQNGRKNTCNADTYVVERKVTFVPPDIESLDLRGLIESMNPHLRRRNALSFIFSVINENNKFAVWPNKNLYEVVFRSEGRAQWVTPGQFMMIFWHEVLQKQVVPLLKSEWPGYPEFYAYTKEKTTWEFLETREFRPAMVNAFMRSELYKDLKSAITSHLKQVTRAERMQITVNMGYVDVGVFLYTATTGDRTAERPKHGTMMSVEEDDNSVKAPWDE
jgi:hypothetical protein